MNNQQDERLAPDARRSSWLEWKPPARPAIAKRIFKIETSQLPLEHFYESPPTIIRLAAHG